MANVVLDFLKSAADTTQPEKGTLRYEAGRRYTFDHASPFARACIAEGTAIATESDDAKAIAELRKLEPKNAAPPSSPSPEDPAALPAVKTSEDVAPKT